MDILFLGHSLVEYFDWQGRFPAHRVRNLGVAGETTAELRARVAAVVKEHPTADAVLVMTGTNDVLMGDSPFLEDFAAIASALRRAFPEARLVIHGILPVREDWIAGETLREVNGKIAGMAAAADAEFLDLTDRFSTPGGSAREELLEEDGVHLSAEGYRLWAEALEDLLMLRDLQG